MKKMKSDIKTHYQNSNCLIQRESELKQSVGPIMKETETFWSDWTMCSTIQNQSTRIRKRSFKLIRNHSQ